MLIISSSISFILFKIGIQIVKIFKIFTFFNVFFSLLYCERSSSHFFVSFCKRIPSFLQKFPLAKNRHELYPWLTPLAFESFDLADFDVVISVTSAEAKGVITKPETLHLCYCLTPTRYLWSGREDYLGAPGFGALDWFARPIARTSFNYLQRWDQIAAQRPDAYLAISHHVQKRIKKYYINPSS